MDSISELALSGHEVACDVISHAGDESYRKEPCFRGSSPKAIFSVLVGDLSKRSFPCEIRKNPVQMNRS